MQRRFGIWSLPMLKAPHRQHGSGATTRWEYVFQGKTDGWRLRECGYGRVWGALVLILEGYKVAVYGELVHSSGAARGPTRRPRLYEAGAARHGV